MSGMAELRSYVETEFQLEQRLNELRRLEAKAHRGWTESKGHDVMLNDWTKAIERANETAQALALIRKIIQEIQGKYPDQRLS